MLPTAKLRRRNSASGSIGCALRASHTTKLTNRIAPATSGTDTLAAPHPCSGCEIRP